MNKFPTPGDSIYFAFSVGAANAPIYAPATCTGPKNFPKVQQHCAVVVGRVTQHALVCMLLALLICASCFQHLRKGN
jgi:hypothetical protein